MSNKEEVGMPIVALLLPKQHPMRVTQVNHMLAALADTTKFTNVPGLAAAQDNATAYAKSVEKAKSRSHVDVKARNAAWVQCKQDAGHLRDFVQGVADKAGSPAAAAAIIASAGMGIKKVTPRVKPPLAAKNVAPSGTVRVDARRVAANAMYYWSFSTDQVHWQSVPETMQAHTLISGLTPGQTYYFRFSARTRKGPVDVSQVVSLIVH